MTGSDHVTHDRVWSLGGSTYITYVDLTGYFLFNLKLVKNRELNTLSNFI